MTYRAPIADILHTTRFARGGRENVPAEADGTLEAVVREADRFAREVLLPLDPVGDRAGIRFADGRLTTAPGWREAYRRWVEAGWSGLAAPEAFGGQALGHLVQAAVQEVWHGANLSFALCPLLTAGAVEALAAHGSPALQTLYLPRLVSGEWAGTMNLTEPQAGSDLGALRTRAEPAPDGSYRITGQKIFISYGEQDLTENIVHLVLARLPDAAPGSRGISMFLVPKILPAPDGTPGARNRLACVGVERKLGMHGAPTCTMAFDGATGFLVGQAGRGLNAMFTMMNRARLAVGLEGVGAAERATQGALAYARTRRQGRTPGEDEPVPILAHPDVARMLLTMKALTAASRALCYRVAAALDEAETGETAGRPDAAARAALLTPVAKSFSTDAAIEVASLNIQVHGGTGYVEDTGAAQIARDVRILAIYEGTNGIQAIDLVTRKIGPANRDAMDRELDRMQAIVDRLAATNDPAFGRSAARLAEAVEALGRATEFLRQEGSTDRSLAGATPYLRLFGLAGGGAALAEGALASRDPERVALLRFFAERLLNEAPSLAATVIEGGEATEEWPRLVLAAAEALA